MINSSQKDLIVLAADNNMRAAMLSVLDRYESLDIRRISFDIYVHPRHDPGCLLNAHSFLQPFAQNYLFSLVMFDKEGCGQEEKTVAELERGVEGLLSESKWKDRSCAITIDPELETWVWKKSPHVTSAIGWTKSFDDLYSWLKTKGYLKEGEYYPEHPKEALEAVLRTVRKPRSSSIYSELGSNLGLKNCTDPSFLRLQSHLQSWFPPNNSD